jgi:hypothetical protein
MHLNHAQPGTRDIPASPYGGSPEYRIQISKNPKKKFYRDIPARSSDPKGGQRTPVTAASGITNIPGTVSIIGCSPGFACPIQTRIRSGDSKDEGNLYPGWEFLLIHVEP